MPHFVVDCSQSVLQIHSNEEILARLHQATNSTGLFDESDIKIRVNSYPIYTVGGQQQDFIHVFSHILQGRTVEQRADLAKAIVSELVHMFPQVSRIAANVAEFEKASYFNRAMMGDQ